MSISSILSIVSRLWQQQTIVERRLGWRYPVASPRLPNPWRISMTEKNEQTSEEETQDSDLNSENDGGSQIVGKTSATEREAITSDKFSFWLPDDVIVNPFDIVEVEQVNQPDQPESATYGLVTMLEHRTGVPNHLANFISSNFGEVSEDVNSVRQGTTVAYASVMSNNEDIYMPLPTDRLVHFADTEGIEIDLGIDQKEIPLNLRRAMIRFQTTQWSVS